MRGKPVSNKHMQDNGCIQLIPDYVFSDGDYSKERIVQLMDEHVHLNGMPVEVTIDDVDYKQTLAGILILAMHVTYHGVKNE